MFETVFICEKSGELKPDLDVYKRQEYAIRQRMVDEGMLKGVISMPSNIFANTGTNVSILFLDKANTDGKVLLLDASKLGTKVKDGKNQKTVLSDDEVARIINTFVGHQVEDDFSVSVSTEDIKNKGYSFSAGQYFEVKIEQDVYKRQSRYFFTAWFMV